MKIENITNQNNSFKKNFFIKYSNKFMSNVEPKNDGNVSDILADPKSNDKKMGLETLTIFPKEVKDGKTIITA